MKHVLIGFFLLLLIFLLVDTRFKEIKHPTVAVLPTPLQQVIGTSDTTITTYISKVIDGDTIQTKDGQKIRYIGINAPESGQPYGKEATDFNKNLVMDKKVRIVYGQEKKDQYGRMLGYVYVGSIFVNREMLQKGWAVTESISPNTIHEKEFAEVEKEARKTCQGIWSDTCMPLTNSCLAIHTIHYDAGGEDDHNLNGEWVEIVNACVTPVDLSGWLLKDSSAMNAYFFGAISLGSHQSVRLHSGCGNDTASDIYWQCPAKLHAVWNNTGDEAMLFDTHGKLLSVYKY